MLWLCLTCTVHALYMYCTCTVHVLFTRHEETVEPDPNDFRYSFLLSGPVVSHYYARASLCMCMCIVPVHRSAMVF